MRSPRRTAAVGATAAALAAAVVAPTSYAAAPTVTNGCITSVPDLGAAEPVEICYTLFQPAGATDVAPVPMLLHSHGWGGSRETEPAAIQPFLDRGYGVLSFDQRGFGESGGKAHVEHPEVEGADVRSLVDLVAELPWVVKDAPGDPRLGAIGGSYGGGYQYVGAFTDLAERGDTRFDALAPEYTWWDVNESLAPQGVPRSAWTAALWAAGNASDAHTQLVHEGFAYGLATGDYPGPGDPVDLYSFFEKNGPRWHAANGRRLDVPVLFRQGVSDNLFNLNQGLKILDGALTPRARAHSVFVGFHGGHSLPSAFPAGVAPQPPVALGGAGADPCSPVLLGGQGTFTDLTLRFFDVHLKGANGAVPGQGAFALATPDEGCLVTDDLGTPTTVGVAGVTTTVGAGAPQYVPLADGPVSVAGTPYVDAKVTTLTPEARAFFALAAGTSPADARIVHNNTLPLREPVAVTGAARRIELPAVAVEVPVGQRLFLMVTPVADMYGTHGSRVPGALILSDVKVRIPVVTP